MGFDESVLREGEAAPDRVEAAALLQRANVVLEALGAQWRRCLTINAHERLALLHLWESGPITMSELGERIPLSRAAVTALTDRLERMGYVLRTPDEQDRRRTLLSLTSRPTDVVVPVAIPYAQDICKAAEALSDDEWDTVSRFIQTVYDTTREHARRLQDLSDDDLHDLVDAGQRAKRG
jgi:DNA-binding MarR family transcriptional regulator